MEQDKNSAWWQKAVSENEKGPEWYNDKVKLALSFLFWPLLAYGIYKTDLIKPRTKWIIGVVFCFFLLIGMFGKKNGG